jgi:hypothetical protein
MIVELEADQVWSVAVGRGRGRGVEVRVMEGEVWLTREGDPEDHVLAAPRVFESARRGRLAVTALRATRLEVVPLARPTALHQERPATAGAR